MTFTEKWFARIRLAIVIGLILYLSYVLITGIFGI
jgi:hypothetical protein